MNLKQSSSEEIITIIKIKQIKVFLLIQFEEYNLKFYIKIIQMDLNVLIKVKDEGNELFKNKNYEQAIRKFKECVNVMQKQQDKQFLSKNTETSKLYVVCLINAALSAINVKNLQKYDEAINYCNMALSIDPDNIKGLYRRGIARKQKAEILQLKNGVKYQGLLQQYKKSEQDFQKLCMIDNKNDLAKKNLTLVTKDIYRVTVGRGQKVQFNTQEQRKQKKSETKVLQQQNYIQKTRKKGKDMQKIMKQYKVQQVTTFVQEKVRSQYLTNQLPTLRSQFEKAIRTLQKSEQTYLQFVYRITQQYLTRIQPTFDTLANMVNILIRKGSGEQAKKVFLAIQKQKSWKLLWKSYTSKEKQILKQKYKQVGLPQQSLNI